MVTGALELSDPQFLGVERIFGVYFIYRYRGKGVHSLHTML